MLNDFDLVVLGGGPAGQKAALQGAKSGCRVLLVDRARTVGGSCLRFGAIPSKALRETAVALHRLERLTGRASAPSGIDLGALLDRQEHIIHSHERYSHQQLSRAGVTIWQGVAHFRSPHEVEVRQSEGGRDRVRARWFVIATGSYPMNNGSIPIDHEHVLDSDSILSLTSLPESLLIIGSGVVAAEHASTFAALGTRVTLVDSAHRPLAFLDEELTSVFVSEFSRLRGRYLGERELRHLRIAADGRVHVELDRGEKLKFDKVLSAVGRKAAISGLGLEAAGVRVNDREFITVDENCQTNVKHIYAVGDVAGPPAMASTAMAQGRRAICHALGIQLREGRDVAPLGIYTIPEIASVGMTEDEATAKYGEIVVGRAPFHELTRGKLASAESGLLKLVCDAQSGRILGVHAVGENATDLVHVGQVAMLGGVRYDAFIDTVFNFPSYAEAYRVATLDILSRERTRNAAE
ncbi:MAG TPA: Si-specific NAD(P)(+) transhydrogenase [Polyangiaceae bacterium]|nr:Si-specific NAD(P)(+) transhydrogenase [Polyangiaceae bacterium]